jgi:tetratricopeptide (TPR) repeat protein
MAVKLNPLATIKGKKLGCELCGRPATLACQHCRVTYYCCAEHQSTDWFGIHEKTCQLLGALRSLKPTLGSEDERRRHELTVQMSQHALIDLCKNEAQKFLVQGQYELAVPGALQSLRFATQVYGAGHIELVSPYLLLAETNLGLKRYQMAEEFLLYANWSLLKNPRDCTNAMRAEVARNFGRLYASQKRYADALRQLANDVYYCSLEHGPEHVQTAAGLFYMSHVFLAQDRVEPALSVYDKVVDVWFKLLMAARESAAATGAGGEGGAAAASAPVNALAHLPEAQVAEAEKVLGIVLDNRKRFMGEQHLAVGEAAFTLGLLKQLSGVEGGRSLMREAYEIYRTQLGDAHPSTLVIEAQLGLASSAPAKAESAPAAAKPTEQGAESSTAPA